MKILLLEGLSRALLVEVLAFCVNLVVFNANLQIKNSASKPHRNICLFIFINESLIVDTYY